MTERDADGKRLSRAILHSGTDLANAFDRSIGPPAQGGGRESTLLAASRDLFSMLAQVLRAPSLRVPTLTTVITGTERQSKTAMRVLFRGKARSLSFCARHILGTSDYELSPHDGSPDRDYDVVVGGYACFDIFDRRPALCVPQWLRQNCELGGDWQQTLGRIPSSLRKRLARALGNSGYAARLDSGAAAMNAFYHGMYVPFVSQRFGPDAIVLDERAFMRQAADAALLELWLANERVGAVLVSQDGDTLYMGKSAMTLEHTVPYRSDLLDYFCFLLAQLCGCRWLDLGVTRPHLEDGVFVNKSKWRPELLPVGGLQTSLRIRPQRNSPAVMGFLRSNGFIEYRAGEFLVRRLEAEHVADASNADGSDRLIERFGLDAFIVVPCDCTDPLRKFMQLA